jgi:hypothetical protein
MRTDDLIADLSIKLKPVSRGALGRVLAVRLACGAVATTLLTVLWLGLRPDLAFASSTAAFWMKATYTLMLALVSFLLVERAGRPGVRLWPTAGLVVVVFAIIATVGMMQMMHAPTGLRPAMLFGGSFTVCPWLIMILSLPIILGVLLAMRRMAPTRPMLAGAAAGLLAGAAGASLYGLHCTESSAMFVAVWYSLGIAGVAVIGAVCGRFALR